MEWTSKISEGIKFIDKVERDRFMDYTLTATFGEQEYEADLFIYYANVRAFVVENGLNKVVIEQQNGYPREVPLDIDLYMIENQYNILIEYIEKTLDFKVINIWT